MNEDVDGSVQQWKQKLQQRQNSVAAEDAGSVSTSQQRQKLELRSSQSLQDQINQLYQYQQQQPLDQAESPYGSNYQDVLFPQGLFKMANSSNFSNALMSSVANDNLMSGDFLDRNSYLANLQTANDQHQNLNAALTDGSSYNSPIDNPRLQPSVKRQNSTFTDALAGSSTMQQGLGVDMSQRTPRSQSISQSDFPVQPNPQTSNQMKDGVPQNDENKRKDNMSSLPLHLDFEMQLDPGGMQQSSNSSTLTEFTKRRNWSQRIIEELQDLLIILTPNGKIRYLSPNSLMLSGYHPDELLGRMIIDYVHTDDSHIFIREFNEAIASNATMNIYFRIRKKDNSYVIFEANGHPHSSDQRQGPSNSATSVCTGFFLMARQYPTKNTGLLDSFLEHKIEHERLKRRIAELRLEEYEDQQAQIQAKNDALSKSNMNTPDGGGGGGAEAYQDARAVASKTMPPPALTRQNLEGFNNSAIRQDSLRDKMARYEGVTHADTIEMLTGLRYTEGERSRGISTGDTSPSLIRGDAGVPMSADRESRGSGERKKKVKVTNEYVCTDCGTLDSPEWRKGPTGPKTLCNACGLRWAKKEKKRSSVSGPSQPPPLGGQVPPVPHNPTL